MAPEPADLVTRLAWRGAPRPPSCEDPGRECGPLPPPELVAVEGSQRLHKRIRGFVSTVLRARTVPELRDECRRCTLPAAGSKEELVERLAGALGGFSTGCCADSPPRRRRVSVKSPETPPAVTQSEANLLSCRKVASLKRKLFHEEEARSPKKRRVDIS
mmetsp:Transcript_53843/g.125229  ORF Transcript_53843/g.125229 Transcript_53843/m.125229 type:complete len:160 (-) Transcript_53843:116-595(-)